MKKNKHFARLNIISVALFLTLNGCYYIIPPSSSRSSSPAFLSSSLSVTLRQCLAQCQKQEQCLAYCQQQDISCLDACQIREESECKKYCKRQCQAQLAPANESQTLEEFILENDQCSVKELDLSKWQ